MRYVIIRDDDTNALTPVGCLERLYRPFLDRCLPVNLAVIPDVSTSASYSPGNLELFLTGGPPHAGSTCDHVPIGCNRELVDYLLANPLYKIAQHGCSHESVNGCYEFDHNDREEIVRRLEKGRRCLSVAGLGEPSTFVAPYDRLSRASLDEVARRFRILSTGWYEWRRLPLPWWPGYLGKKLSRSSHWRVGQTILLSHPGCHLSYHRSYSLILQAIEDAIHRERLTILVTHWWEYFRHGVPDKAFIDVLHKTADHLASRPDVRVISFDDIARLGISLK